MATSYLSLADTIGYAMFAGMLANCFFLGMGGPFSPQPAVKNIV